MWCGSPSQTPNDSNPIINTPNNSDDDGNNDDQNENEENENEENINDEKDKNENDDDLSNNAPIDSITSYTMNDVATNNTESSCRTAIRGKVYNLTARVDAHPGGDKNILRLCWIDGTEAFEKQHGGKSKPEDTLAWFQIGLLN